MGNLHNAVSEDDSGIQDVIAVEDSELGIIITEAAN